MRVISLVPSLTETLLDCGVDVVGRTRFCIHPKPLVANIPAVGGTKAVDWQRCASLEPDLIVMDREENTLEMAESCPFDWLATHITSVENVGDELKRLAVALQNESLDARGNQWRELAALPPVTLDGLHDLPGQQALIGESDGSYKRVEYMIWRDPWMAVGHQTFIGSVLAKIGLGHLIPDHAVPYPTLNADQIPDPDTFYLFSTEPFPFDRYEVELAESGFNGAVVDGEFYSWFGSRSFRLLSAHLMKQQQ